MSGPLFRMNEKYSAGAAPAVIQVSSPAVLPSPYSFALEQQVLERQLMSKDSLSRLANVEVRFRGSSKRIKLPRQLQGGVLVQKLRGVCESGAADVHVEVNGRMIAKLEDYVAFSDGDLILVATVDDQLGLLQEEDKIPCDRCGEAVLVSMYLEHEKNCK